MNIKYSKLMLGSLVLALNLYGQDSYTLEKQSLEMAIKQIATTSNMPYVAKGKVLEGKFSNAINNVEGTQNALDELLKNSNLKAIIKKGIILIVKKDVSQSKINLNDNTNNLGSFEIIEQSNITENSDSYTIDHMSTATKMDLSIKDTPQTVSVVTNQKMKDYSLDTINKVLAFTPGISVENSESERTKYTSRGFDISNFQVDGINLPLSEGRNYGDEDTIIYDHIEITRGASGLMSGAGDPSATINMIRKKPTRNLQANASLIIGSNNKRKISADISNRLHDKLRARIIVSKENSDSYLDRYKTDNTLFYSIFEADLSDHTLLTFGYKKSNENPKNPMWGALALYYTDGTATNWERSANTAATWSYWDITKTELFATLSHQFENDWKINIAGTSKKTKLNSELLYIYGTPTVSTNEGLTGYAAKYRVGDTNEKTIDIHAKGPYTLFGYQNSAVIGVSWAKRETDETSLYDFTTGNGFPAIGDFTQWQGITPYPTLEDGPEIANFIDKEKAIYMATNMNISSNISLVLGGRITSWDKDVITHKALKDTKNSSIITPYAGIVYRLNTNNTLYGNYSTSFTPQAKIDINSKQLDYTESINYEIGTKASYLNNQLNTSLALFRIEQKNAPIHEGKLINGDDYYSVDDGVRSDGFSAEISGRIFRELDSSISYTKLKIKNTNGNKIRTYIPSQTIKLATTYSIKAITGLKIGASVNWQDDIYREQGIITVGPDTGEYAISKQKAYSLINLMTSYKINKNFSATLNVNNITNEKYLTSLYYKDQSFYGAPTSVYLKLKWTY